MIPLRKPTGDPVTAKLIENDRQLREAMGTLTDFAHVSNEQLLAACDTIERLSHSPSLLLRAQTFRKLAERECPCTQSPSTSAAARP